VKISQKVLGGLLFLTHTVYRHAKFLFSRVEFYILITKNSKYRYWNSILGSKQYK